MSGRQKLIMLGVIKFKEKVMRQAGELIKKPLAVVLLLILLLPLLAGCGGDDRDKQGDALTSPQIIPVEKFYTPTPAAVASGPDLQATRAALRATEIDQALRSIEARVTPAP